MGENKIISNDISARCLVRYLRAESLGDTNDFTRNCLQEAMQHLAKRTSKPTVNCRKEHECTDAGLRETTGWPRRHRLNF